MTKKKFYEAVYDFAGIVTTSIVAVTFIFAFLFKVSVVNGRSMYSTLNDRDRLIISARDWNIEQGDIVIISQPNDYEKVLIKRVIAKGGQTVRIENGKVSVDGEVLDEPYLRVNTLVLGDLPADNPEVTVPEGCLFVMGDNRNESADSRFDGVGFIDERYVVGEAVYRIGDKQLLNKRS